MFARFCPSVFFYLASVVPAIWFLELQEMESRIADKQTKQANLTAINDLLQEYTNGTAVDIIVSSVPGLKVGLVSTRHVVTMNEVTQACNQLLLHVVFSKIHKITNDK